VRCIKNLFVKWKISNIKVGKSRKMIYDKVDGAAIFSDGYMRAYNISITCVRAVRAHENQTVGNKAMHAGLATGNNIRWVSVEKAPIEKSSSPAKLHVKLTPHF
jgi:hypothetical protein